MKKVAQELCEQKQNNWANIKGSKVWQYTSYWTQQRLMYSRQGIDHHPDERLPGINYLECNQPAYGQVCQQGPDVKVDNLVDKRRYCVHENLLCLILFCLRR